MNIYLITTLFAYAVSLHRGLNGGGHFILCPEPKKWGSCPSVGSCPPVPS